ncbi:hypothetical protein [Listeria booriae]|uniref:hypothetical protein n=1 Tax=Listeria booriae TaxID=1552123 RepID=UPI00164D3D97|nr:hypothetical protein [Listeria booriae]MBC6301489.1 hypothetical protein [Listeria booriae]
MGIGENTEKKMGPLNNNQIAPSSSHIKLYTHYLLGLFFSNSHIIIQQLIPATGMLTINHTIVLGKIS